MQPNMKAGYTLGMEPDGREHLVVAIKGTFNIPEDGGEPGLLEEQVGERIDLKAENQITLKCGKASITLTNAGKVIIRGTYLLNRSSGVNRIKGGSVQIN